MFSARGSLAEVSEVSCPVRVGRRRRVPWGTPLLLSEGREGDTSQAEPGAVGGGSSAFCRRWRLSNAVVLCLASVGKEQFLLPRGAGREGLSGP